jgi:DNA-binding transcriptional LysR family regulator
VLRAWDQTAWIGPGERLGRSPPGQWLHAHAQGVHPRFRSDSLRMQIAAVVNDVGVALLPAGSVAHYGLARVRVGKQLRSAVARLPSSSLFLVTHRASRTVPRIRVVHDLLVERLRAKR